MRDSKVLLALAALALFGGGFGLGWLVRGERPVSTDVGLSDGVREASAAIGDAGSSADGGAEGDRLANGAGSETAAGSEAGRAGAEGDVAVVGVIDPNARIASGSAAGDDTDETTPGSSSDGGSPGSGSPGSGAPGRLDASSIRDVMRGHHEELGFCFAWQLHTHPDLGGRLTMEFEIDPDGEVAEARIVDDGLGDGTVARCFLSVARRMEFPAPEGGGSLTVRYPFVLTADDDGEAERASRPNE